MKKKIAIVFNRMIVGGAEKALVRLLREIDLIQYDIILYTYDNNSCYLNEIPTEISVRFVKEINTSFIADMKERKVCVHDLVKHLIYRFLLKCTGNEYKKCLYSMKSFPYEKEHYDCAIAYKLNYEDTAFVLGRLKANKKFVYVHSSVGTEPICPDHYIAVVSRYIDKFFCVSDTLKKNLEYIYKQNIGKAEVVHNIIPYDEIYSLAEVELNQPLNPVALVTVGRLSAEKGQDMIPEVTRMLLDAGENIYWYIIGEGTLRRKIEDEIRRYQVADHVILLGMQEKPYSYIKNCNIYVQTSFLEGYCTTTMEAKALCKPVVTTNAPGMNEQFVSGVNGLIVDSMTPGALFEGIKKLIENPEMCKKFVENLKHEKHDNTEELQKLYNFIEG